MTQSTQRCMTPFFLDFNFSVPFLSRLQSPVALSLQAVKFSISSHSSHPSPHPKTSHENLLVPFLLVARVSK